MIAKPHYSDAPEYYRYYIDLIPEDDLLIALQKSMTETIALMESIPLKKENFGYINGKWTINEVFRHIIDCERIFAYRALRFSRKDTTVLAGFDENQYNIQSPTFRMNLQEIKEEFVNVRKSSIDLFKPMTNDMLDFKGTANKLQVTTRALAAIIVGHGIHHCNIIKSRYL